MKSLDTLGINTGDDKHNDISRRKFLKLSGLTGPGLIIGFNLISKHAVGADSSVPATNDFEPNVFLRIGSDGSIVIKAKNPEIGQGVKTSFPQIIAEELEVDWRQIRVEQGHYDLRFDGQFAGGSTSVKENFLQLRKAGAAAREMLVEAASRKWGLPISECYAKSGFVCQKNKDIKASYAELAEDASKLGYREAPKLKDVKDFKIIGKGLAGVDNFDIVTGKAEFGLDAKPKGMLVAVIARCPVRGGKVKSFDASKALLISGVKEVFDFDFTQNDIRESVNGVAVIAENTWAAIKGRNALVVNWDFKNGENENSERIRQAFEENLRKTGSEQLRKDGNPEDVFLQSPKKLEATYEVQFLSHAPMEPMNYIADVQPDQCNLWGPTQVPGLVRRNAQTITGLPTEKISIKLTRVGGGFGRRLNADYSVEAIVISKKIGKPVQVVWTREDDMSNDLYRPAGMYRFKGTVDDQGKMTSWQLHATSTSRYMYANRTPHSSSEVFPDSFPAGFISHFKIEYSPVKTNIATGAWRGPGHNATAFVEESFTDELAHLAGKDPVVFRLETMGVMNKIMPYRDHGGPEYRTDRLKNVMNEVCKMADWYGVKTTGVYKGFACHFMFGAYVAQVVIVSVNSQKQIKIEKVFCAVDCGLVINESGAKNQIEGGIIDGLQIALGAAITIEKGGSKEKNFDTYKLFRLKDAPSIDVYFVPSQESPEGLGEMSTPPISAALCNAIFAATGKRIRRLPFSLVTLT